MPMDRAGFHLRYITLPRSLLHSLCIFSPIIIPPFHSTWTTTHTAITITPIDSASFQLQYTTFPHTPHYRLSIFAINKQESACQRYLRRCQVNFVHRANFFNGPNRWMSEGAKSFTLRWVWLTMCYFFYIIVEFNYITLSCQKTFF